MEAQGGLLEIGVVRPQLDIGHVPLPLADGVVR